MQRLTKLWKLTAISNSAVMIIEIEIEIAILEI